MARRLKPAIELISAIGSLGFDLQQHSDVAIQEAVTLLRTVNADLFTWLIRALSGLPPDPPPNVDPWNQVDVYYARIAGMTDPVTVYLEDDVIACLAAERQLRGRSSIGNGQDAGLGTSVLRNGSDGIERGPHHP